MYALLFVCTWHDSFLLVEKSSAVRGDFFYKEQEKQHLKQDEMGVFSMKKRSNDRNDVTDAAMGMGCDQVRLGEVEEDPGAWLLGVWNYKTNILSGYPE